MAALLEHQVLSGEVQLSRRSNGINFKILLIILTNYVFRM